MQKLANIKAALETIQARRAQAEINLARFKAREKELIAEQKKEIKAMEEAVAEAKKGAK